MDNYKNPEIRNEIKRRIQAELQDPNLPKHRRWICERIMYEIEVWEKEEELKKKGNEEVKR